MLKRFKKWPRRKQILVVVAILSYAIIGMSGGCGAYKRPPALRADEQTLLQSEPLPYSVTVAWWDKVTATGQDPEAYGGALARLVASSGAFRTTRYERSSTPVGQDLVATSTGVYCNTAVIPIFTILSLGVIPTIFRDEQCEGMLLRSAAGEPKSNGVEIEVRHKAPVVMGWVAVAIGALPGWSYGEVRTDARFAQRFRLAVIRRRVDIDRLVAR